MTAQKFHDIYRKHRALGRGKIDSLKLARTEDPALYKAYCKGQENGEAWTREPLDEKDQARRLQIITTGKLI